MFFIAQSNFVVKEKIQFGFKEDERNLLAINVTCNFYENSLHISLK